MSEQAGNGRELRTVIIGAGMAGSLSAIQLRAAAYSNRALDEKADRPRGTRRENTYPGLACDLPAYRYTCSFEPNPAWSRTFAPGPGIRRYFRQVAGKHGVTPGIRFTEVMRTTEFDAFDRVA